MGAESNGRQPKKGDEIMPEEKRKWVKPMLMVLTRGGDRSESILATCKSWSIGGPVTHQSACMDWWEVGGVCIPPYCSYSSSS
jgi:hypothetical protein